LVKYMGLANLEAIVFAEKSRDLVAAYPHVAGTLVLGYRLDGLHCLGTVGRDDHGHIRYHAHHCDVLDGLVRSTVLSYGDPRMTRHDLNAQVRVADRLPHLLPGPSGGKNREGAYERQLARNCEPCGGAHHVLLGNTDIKKTVRERLGELRGLRRAR